MPKTIRLLSSKNLTLPQATVKYYHALVTIQQSSPTRLNEKLGQKNYCI
jgi:hypothetical protein